MKINCDVCNKDEALVFCSADDAALCADCDHRVHHANNLAGKHPRFSLLPPSPKDSPLCDICQEEKALLFCQQDRATLCKNCDAAIHKVNEQKTNHCRFVLIGVKLSPVPLLPTVAKPKSRHQEPITAIVNHPQKFTSFVAPKSNGSGHGSTAASSISDYLIETLPGWHVEDFLDSAPNISKVDEEDLATFWDDELLKESMNDCFSAETMGIWVPQVPSPAAPPLSAPPQSLFHNSYQPQPYLNMSFGSQMVSESSPFFVPTNLDDKITRSNGKRESDDGHCFTVPQISHPMTANFKRSRTIRY